MHSTATWSQRLRRSVRRFATSLWRQAASVTLALSAVLLVGNAAAAVRPAAESATPDRQAVQQALAGLAVPFEQNQGQFDPQVAYMAKTFAGAVFVTRDGRIVYSLPGKPLDADTSASQPPQRQQRTERGPGWALQETLLGAQALTPQGTAAASTHITRFTPAGTHQASTWQGVRLGQAWPGVEVELSARGNNVEKLFHVAPGADAGQIGIALEGAQSLRIDADGRLIAGTGNGEVAYTAPIAWQDIDGQRVSVDVRYALKQTQGSAHHYGFVLAAHDPRHPLTIDPLIQSTYLGGSDNDYISALALASNGEVLVAGYTYSSNLPGTTGGAQAAYAGSYDGFVARLSGNLQTLEQSSYLGGGSDDHIYALALASNGDVLVAGITISSDLPGTAGGAQPAYAGGGYDGFVARLSGNLQTLVQSSYLGGSGDDRITALALASNGDVLVAGSTDSSNLPGTTGGAQAAFAGGIYDGFVTRLTGNLQTLVRSSYLGGSSYEEIRALALASNGDVLVAGVTDSTDLPGTTGGAQAAIAGNYDGFVARLSDNLQTLVQSSYLGGGGHDDIRALALASNGDVLVAGKIGSTDLPGTAGGAQAANAGGYDGFVARLSGNLQTLVQSSYLGGGAHDDIRALALASNGEVLVAGHTTSTNLPGTAGGAQAAHAGGRDGFVTRLTGNLQTLVQSTYLGGGSNDYISTLALASNGDVLVAGETGSSNLPGTAGGAQAAYGGGFADGFVTRLTVDEIILADGFE
ncbi:hypothetical protein [Dokdonella sp.]|uniref:DUF7948 domain-containing protein n=2 Tax=Dokdonella sp. TaxID=2291710 RepID=UPI0025C01B59|nr:hypothetical protein [Dokdonella sp.]MBX3693217.1 hypothetical protein [Dokdonella sp.]